MSSVSALSVLIVDDEALARARLRLLLGDLAATVATRRIDEAADAASALALLAQQRFDLLLLDIQMPGLPGTGLAAQLKGRADALAIVFVTAHAEHALAAFDLDAVDYLTKPVRLDRLRAALQRVQQRRGANPPPAAPTAGGEPPVIVVSERGRVERVPLDDVLYLKAELKYVTLRTAARSYVLDESLAELEPRLGDRFMRVHRNALVARHAVRALERRVLNDGDDDGGEAWAVQVAATDEWLAVSRRQVGAVREALLSALS